MNKENIQKAITVMERVKGYETKFPGQRLLNMNSYIDYAVGENMPTTEQESIASPDEFCGTTCCVSGWLALSPEFKELGVIQGEDGEALLPEVVTLAHRWDSYQQTVTSLAYLFDLPAQIVDNLIYDFEIETLDEVIGRMNFWLDEHENKHFESREFE